MNKTILATLLLLSGSALNAFSNGGGYADGGVSETGNIVGFIPTGTEAVQIWNEDLDITLKPEGASVKVVYQLKNQTDKTAKVRFGFPVEELQDEGLNEDGSAEDAIPTNSGKLQYCRDYRVTWNGDEVKAVFEIQPDANISVPHRKGVKGWLVSEISVPPGDEQTLNIAYFSDFPTESVSVSDDSHSSAKHFTYRLSTGAAWAGPIAKGNVTIRAEGLPSEEIRVLAPAGKFSRTGKSWTWKFENLEPTLADDLKVEAVPAESTYGYRQIDGSYGAGDGFKPVTFVERNERWYVRHQNFSKITASSTLAPQKGISYLPKNVGDNNWETVWVEGAKGSGVGEWIEVELEVPKPLQSVNVQGGYLSDTALFLANARPKQVELLLNGEHKITAKLLDREESTDIPVIDYKKPVQTVRLTIQAVYPGEKWQDCAITGIEVTTAISKKPNVQPAR